MPAFAILDNRDGKTVSKYEWWLVCFSMSTFSVLSFSIWYALYYITWQPIKLLAIAFIPWVIFGNIFILFCEKRIKSET